MALARAGSISLAWRAFTSAMTRPMSFIELAPVSTMIAWIAALASSSLSCLGRKRSMTAVESGLRAAVERYASGVPAGEETAALETFTALKAARLAKQAHA